VAGNPHAVGFVSVGTAAYEAARGTPIKLLAANGKVATMENVRRGDFPIVRTLHLVTEGKLDPHTEAFIAFCQSAETHDLVTEQFFVPLAP